MRTSPSRVKLLPTPLFHASSSCSLTLVFHARIPQCFRSTHTWLSTQRFIALVVIVLYVNTAGRRMSTVVMTAFAEMEKELEEASRIYLNNGWRCESVVAIITLADRRRKPSSKPEESLFFFFPFFLFLFSMVAMIAFWVKISLPEDVWLWFLVDLMIVVADIKENSYSQIDRQTDR